LRAALVHARVGDIQAGVWPVRAISCLKCDVLVGCGAAIGGFSIFFLAAEHRSCMEFEWS
jgi:hypothetical protein